VRVILLERIPKLGLMGDLVNVKPGYARNYLLPQGKALKDTPTNIKYFESRRQELEAHNLERRQEAEQVGAKLEGRTFILIRSAADTGSLYGSVSKSDIAKATSAEGVTINRSQIDLERPIKELGMHGILVSLHPEVDVSITVNVARTLDEAKQQAQGLTIADIADGAEADDDTGAAPGPAEAGPDAAVVDPESSEMFEAQSDAESAGETQLDAENSENSEPENPDKQ